MIERSVEICMFGLLVDGCRRWRYSELRSWVLNQVDDSGWRICLTVYRVSPYRVGLRRPRAIYTPT
jgi:hypothetical protein